MNYDWFYNERNGPDAYYRAFEFCFSRQELEFLRHANKSWVKPGSSHWAIDTKVSPSVEYIMAEGRNWYTTRLRLDLRTSRPFFHLGEAVVVEARLTNTKPGVVVVDGRLSPEHGLCRLFITPPKGAVYEVEPTCHRVISSNTQILDGSANDGSDRCFSIIPLVYGANGFYFPQKGVYSLKAVYILGEISLSSAPISIEVQESELSPIALQRYFTADVGKYLALGAPALPRFFATAKQLLDYSEKYSSIRRTLALCGDDTRVKSLRVTQRDASGSAVVFHHDQSRASIDQTVAALHDCVRTFHTTGSKRDGLAYTTVVKYLVEFLVTIEQRAGAVGLIEQLESDLKRWGVRPTIVHASIQSLLAIARLSERADTLHSKSLSRPDLQVWSPRTRQEQLLPISSSMCSALLGAIEVYIVTER